MSPTDSAMAVLAGTDAAIYAYGLVVAQVTGAEERRALAAMATHRTERDLLLARLDAAGATPPPAAPAYDPPFPVTDEAAARRLAALVEDRLAGQWAGLAAASAGQERTAAALVAQTCAVRCVTWSGVSPIWSGSV